MEEISPHTALLPTLWKILILGKPFFDRFEPVRKKGGELSSVVLRHSEDPNVVTVINTWNSVETAQAFFNHEVLKTSMGEARVTSTPSFVFANAD